MTEKKKKSEPFKTAQEVKSLLKRNKLGMHSDATLTGLFLGITPTQKSWLFVWTKAGRRRAMGLGAATGDKAVSLADARTKAEEARGLLAKGIDPLEAKRAGKPRAGIPTFGEMAEDVIKAKSPGWKDPRHVGQWRQTLSLVRDRKGKLKGYCQNLINVPVDAVTVDHILAVLRPLWRPCGGGKGEAGIVSAGRIRERLWLVLAAAETAGHRPAGSRNPAEWRGHLENLMPKIKHQKKHLAALHWRDLPGYMASLRERKTVCAFALEWTFLGAVRSDETISAAWREIDRESKIWCIPAERMKMDRPHRVPLTARQLAILDEMAKLRPANGDGSSFIFPGAKAGRPMSPNAMRQAPQ
jgi:integrase